MRTWKVVRWDDRPAKVRDVPLDCPHCGTEALMPSNEAIEALIIASFGMHIVFSPGDYTPPDNFMPEVVQCRHCRRILSAETEGD